jgi:6-phosphogluconolactonase
MLKNNWIVFEDIEKLSKQLAGDILSVARKSIKSNGSFKIVLTGGSSIISTYKILSDSRSDWNKWHVYLSDERCLPVKDEDRNNNMINQIWLNNSSIPKNNINFIHAELGVDNGALHYEKILSNISDFDLVLLSMGDDGHSASLFPDRLYDENKSVVTECDSPKYPKNRISISYSRLNRSKKIFKIISGSSKQKAVESWLNGKILPINKIHGQSERVFFCKNALYFLKEIPTSKKIITKYL